MILIFLIPRQCVTALTSTITDITRQVYFYYASLYPLDHSFNFIKDNSLLCQEQPVEIKGTH